MGPITEKDEDLKYRPIYPKTPLEFLFKLLYNKYYNENNPLYSNIEVKPRYDKLRQCIEHSTTNDIIKDIVDKHRKKDGGIFGR